MPKEQESREKHHALTQSLFLKFCSWMEQQETDDPFEQDDLYFSETQAAVNGVLLDTCSLSKQARTWKGYLVCLVCGKGYDACV